MNQPINCARRGARPEAGQFPFKRVYQAIRLECESGVSGQRAPAVPDGRRARVAATRTHAPGSAAAASVAAASAAAASAAAASAAAG